MRSKMFRNFYQLLMIGIFSNIPLNATNLEQQCESTLLEIKTRLTEYVNIDKKNKNQVAELEQDVFSKKKIKKAGKLEEQTKRVHAYLKLNSAHCMELPNLYVALCDSIEKTRKIQSQIDDCEAQNKKNNSKNYDNSKNIQINFEKEQKNQKNILKKIKKILSDWEELDLK
jgi:predicted RND superfamily exporter protein